MFTGIVEALGTVRSLSNGRLVVDAALGREPIQLGESVAVNGVCLTVVSFSEGLAFDLSQETLDRTSLVSVRAGSVVNLERAMRADGRFGGHVVQGHVDATGELVSASDHGVFRFRVPEGMDRYLIDKGSVTIDGISLTVVNPSSGEFDVAVIPHTLSHTNLGSLKPGDRVNLEFDVLAKYVERLLGPR